MKKLLILNCTSTATGIVRLNELLIKLFERYEIDFKIFNLTDKIGNLTEFSHLLITGSAFFASRENEHDEKLYEIVQQFTDKSILGICYGHQMLAKALMSQNVCRKSTTPELGWRKVNLVRNFLFKGISEPVFYQSHFEEVFGLSNDFSIIATNSNCDIQGFQYKNLPIWGVQFHPEVTFAYGQKSIANNRTKFVAKGDFFQDELKYPQQIEQNFKIFENFLKS